MERLREEFVVKSSSHESIVPSAGMQAEHHAGAAEPPEPAQGVESSGGKGEKDVSAETGPEQTSGALAPEKEPGESTEATAMAPEKEPAESTEATAMPPNMEGKGESATPGAGTQANTTSKGEPAPNVDVYDESTLYFQSQVPSELWERYMTKVTEVTHTLDDNGLHVFTVFLPLSDPKNQHHPKVYVRMEAPCRFPA